MAGRAARLAGRGGRAPLGAPRVRRRRRLGGARAATAPGPRSAGRRGLGRAGAGGLRAAGRGRRADPLDGRVPLALHRPPGAALPGSGAPLGPPAGERGARLPRVVGPRAGFVRAAAGQSRRRRRPSPSRARRAPARGARGASRAAPRGGLRGQSRGRRARPGAAGGGGAAPRAPHAGGGSRLPARALGRSARVRAEQGARRASARIPRGPRRCTGPSPSRERPASRCAGAPTASPTRGGSKDTRRRVRPSPGRRAGTRATGDTCACGPWRWRCSGGSWAGWRVPRRDSGPWRSRPGSTTRRCGCGSSRGPAERRGEVRSGRARAARSVRSPRAPSRPRGAAGGSISAAIVAVRACG